MFEAADGTVNEHYTLTIDYWGAWVVQLRQTAGEHEDVAVGLYPYHRKPAVAECDY